MKNFIVPVLHIQIGLVNDFLNDLLYFIESDADKLSKGEEVARNTLVTLNRVIKCTLAPYEWRYQGHLMGTKWNLAGMKLTYKKSLYLSKGELAQAIGFISMAMWYTVTVEDFILPVLHLQIGLGNDV